jgi:hypothetical protein
MVGAAQAIRRGRAVTSACSPCSSRGFAACLRRFRVDSGSTDGSVQLARNQGVDVVELEVPFTAARVAMPVSGTLV